jgi:opacity protein-like surface antigen
MDFSSISVFGLQEYGKSTHKLFRKCLKTNRYSNGQPIAMTQVPVIYRPLGKYVSEIDCPVLAAGNESSETGRAERQLPHNRSRKDQLIMQRIVKSALVGLCISVFFLMLSSSAARAQVLAGSGEVTGYGGYAMISDGGGNHPAFGGSGGYNLVPAVTVFGEYNYVFLNSLDCGPDSIYDGPTGCTLSNKTQLFGGGARYNFMTSGKVVPYGVVAFGGARYTANANVSGCPSDVCSSWNGYYVGFGGGVSLYVGKNWGVRPEYRFDRSEVNGYGNNVSVITGGVFYQFGGHGTEKK